MRSSLGAVANERWTVEESRSVRSVWVWRGFLIMSLIAVGFTILLASNGATGFAAVWGIIAAGWFAISMWLWRMHSNMEEKEYRRLLRTRKR